MSRLRSDEALHTPDGLEGLAGWGSFKKKIGLNKLHTRKTVKAVTAMQKAIIAPTKKNRKAAEDKAKPFVGKALAVASVALPGVGTAASLAWNMQRAKSAKKKIKKQNAEIDIANREALKAEERAAAAERAATEGTGGGSGGSDSSALAPVTMATPEEKKPNYLGWAAGGLLAVKALSLVA